MADTIRRVSYYYTTISDKPGEGARLLETLRSAGVTCWLSTPFRARASASGLRAVGRRVVHRGREGSEDQVVEAEDGLPDRRDDRVGALATSCRAWVRRRSTSRP